MGAGLRQDLPPDAAPALFRADLELDLPSAIRVRVFHPKLKNAELRDDGVDVDRHHLPHRNVAERRDLNFEQASVLRNHRPQASAFFYWGSERGTEE